MIVFVGAVSLESLPSNAIDDLCSTNQCQCQGGQHRRHAISRSSYRGSDAWMSQEVSRCLVNGL